MRIALVVVLPQSVATITRRSAGMGIVKNFRESEHSDQMQSPAFLSSLADVRALGNGAEIPPVRSPALRKCRASSRFLSLNSPAFRRIVTWSEVWRLQLLLFFCHCVLRRPR